MEVEEYQQIKQKNDELAKKLKKRNEEYIYKLRKQLRGRVTMEDQEAALHEILPALIKGQQTGQTAVQLFGSVQECAERIAKGPEEKPVAIKKWQMWLDNTLILFTVLAGFSAVMGIVPTKNPTASQSMMSITSLVVSSMAGGLVFYFFNKYIYQYDLPGADKSKKPKLGKQMLIMGLGILIWYFAMQAAMFLPKYLNPKLPATVLVILAFATYGIRYYMRKKIGYTSAMFTFGAQISNKKK